MIDCACSAGRPCPIEAHRRVDWVIVGAESGHGARPMQDAWARSLRDQCQAAGVPFFLKQQVVAGKKISLPLLDGQQHTAFPGKDSRS